MDVVQLSLAVYLRTYISYLSCLSYLRTFLLFPPLEERTTKEKGESTLAGGVWLEFFLLHCRMGFGRVRRYEFESVGGGYVGYEKGQMSRCILAGTQHGLGLLITYPSLLLVAVLAARVAVWGYGIARLMLRCSGRGRSGEAAWEGRHEWLSSLEVMRCWV